mgnify:CR=1 FL=1
MNGMILHNVIQTIFVIAGITAMLAAMFNWDWFFTARNAEFIVKRLGRNGSRILYGTAGLLFIIAAVYFYYKVAAIR